MDEHVILCIMGRTGSGKSSLADKLCERCNLKQVISYTTRPQRSDQDNGHIFVNELVYNQMRNENQIAAFTEIADNKYWSTVDQLYENNVYVIDPIGVESLRALNLPNLRVVTVYINVPDDVREDRAITIRGDSPKTFYVRDYSESKQFNEMLSKGDFDYSVQNIRFPEAYSVIRWIATVEGVINFREENGDAEDSSGH